MKKEIIFLFIVSILFAGCTKQPVVVDIPDEKESSEQDIKVDNDTALDSNEEIIEISDDRKKYINHEWGIEFEFYSNENIELTSDQYHLVVQDWSNSTFKKASVMKLPLGEEDDLLSKLEKHYQSEFEVLVNLKSLTKEVNNNGTIFYDLNVDMMPTQISRGGIVNSSRYFIPISGDNNAYYSFLGIGKTNQYIILDTFKFIEK
ncbi:MAG: hypothetical protein PF572_04810 [Patescibacteria group bacterium]|jgi:uncharacterized protein YqfB (UPF0267 family)|nr:hypothetical protein [Patescibacteria group bacterium]